VTDSNVIENDKIKLEKVLLDILPNVESADFALGYFFISGFNVIIEPVKKLKKLRLLISNTTNRPTAEALIEGFKTIRAIEKELDKQKYTNQTEKEFLKEDATENVTKSLELMEQTSKDQNVVTALIEMMKNKKIEVRIYSKEKLHAKAYLFENDKKTYQATRLKGTGIVGSSNLSIAGIRQSSELNLQTNHPADYDALKEWFEKLWKEGLEYTEDFQIILEKSWAGKTYSPRELFLKASYLEYKDKIEGQHEIDPIWGTTFPKLFPFQKDAVDQAITMFELYGGVIIADVVGLGKTYVGTALLKFLQLQEWRPLIICPPTLEPMWEKFCVDYEVDAKILSIGKLRQQNFDLFRDYRYKDRDLVLIDESHHFRNNNSRQYENLHQFMQARDAKAILLTATPFSNTATDIKNQIMLFHQTSKTFIPPANETDLDKYFIQVKNKEADLTELLKNIMIRRTRRFVLNQWGKADEKGRKYLQVGNEKKYFPQRRMKTERYDINKVYQRKYRKIVSYLDRDVLTFARYSVGLYLKKEYKEVELYKDLGVAGEKLIGLIRTLLLKRMESSLDAFKVSIKNYVNNHKIFLKLLDEGIMPVGDVSYKKMYEIAQSDPDSINEPETIEEFKKTIEEAGETKYKIEAFDIEKLISAIQNDIEIFEQIDGLIHMISDKTDDKLHRLQKLLDKDYSGKKVLIFSEFATTAKYLNKCLKWKGVKEQVDATGNSIECARRFDPDNNPSVHERPKKSEEISLLISTDVLAEGVNLQAGEVVINYDFHWNPTRLIQRAGRVDRIGSKNEFVMVHNFLLDPEMEEDFGLEYSVDKKIDNIQKLIGEDYKILKEDERVNTKDIYAVYRGGKEGVSILEREEINPLEPSKFEKMLRDIQVNDQVLWEELKKIPDGVRSSGDEKSGGQLLMACESGAGRSGRVRKYYLINLKEKIKEVTSREVLKILESSDESVYTTPSNYDELISVGWKKFIEDTEQIRARASSVRLSTSQKWIIEKLMKMASVKEFSDEKETIETLRKAFSIPILKGKLNRELLQIKKSEMSNSELIKTLSQLYLHYELQNQLKKDEEESKSPRILYSAYIGD